MIICCVSFIFHSYPHGDFVFFLAKSLLVSFVYISVISTNVVMNYSEIESKVREATNDDPWGPSGHLMGEIAKYVKHTKSVSLSA